MGDIDHHENGCKIRIILSCRIIVQDILGKLGPCTTATVLLYLGTSIHQTRGTDSLRSPATMDVAQIWKLISLPVKEARKSMQL